MSESDKVAPKLGVSRRGFLKAAVATLGLAAVGKGAEVIGQVLSAPNSYQKEAGEQLDRKDVAKQIVEVMDDSEVVQSGGLAVRNEPRIPVKGEPPGVEYRLPPGTRLEAIPWVGRSIEIPATRSAEWAAFRDDKGQIRFVNARFLKNITLQSKIP